jgi:hypothetical protein
MRWKYRLLLGFFAIVIGISAYQVLFAPGSLLRMNLSNSIKDGAPLAATITMLTGKGLACTGADPSGASRETTGVLCYGYNNPATAPNGDGTQVALAAENGVIIGFAIRACGPTHKFLCDKAVARPGWR